ncbi:hypothetical protein HMPREF9318_00822 [Streptococcus urinalis FB127-CNA-2]|uniref:PF11674 family protein n=1 Tax=Streptococcus urinalis 2285-97 TaxID=764291 RepID=G5KHV6_9STRE|nr:DUF3270 domain-containing protein [Streptococcus urinalis]EHJ56153.1 hypothetical protein STRUR_1541 [Streptococcus urinalis 2285-97]EKS22624.1 hypothetical protein HMPREF9318_00822 [Streptococcus urinalis FB127-CNA-2]VEF32393.1 membrane protein [Streptococcus urinalis]
MSEPLKQHQHEEEKHLENQEAQPRFQEFQAFNTDSNKLSELLFFARIAFFGIITVLISFAFLVLNIKPIWSFVMASILSLAVTVSLSHVIKSFRQ